MKKMIKPTPPSKVMNYSQCKRAANKLLGPNARVWHGKGTEATVMVGYEMNPGRNILGSGKNYKDALEMAVKNKK